MANNQHTPAPLLGIVGYSGSGKTTLLKALIPLLTQQGLNVGLIKHSHHDVDVDTPGKDSHVLRHSGAHETMVVCDQRWALMTETPTQSPSLYELARQFNRADLILVEGFKHEPTPKIAVYRAALGRPWTDLVDPQLVAIATDTPEAISLDRPLLDLNQPAAIAAFIMAYLRNPS